MKYLLPPESRMPPAAACFRRLSEKPLSGRSVTFPWTVVEVLDPALSSGMGTLPTNFTPPSMCPLLVKLPPTVALLGTPTVVPG